MANVLGELFTDIADSIRGGLGEIGKISPSTFPDRIDEIVAMNNDPVLQDKTITENGEYTADEGFDGLGKVLVNVAGTGGGVQLDGDFLKYIVYQLDDENKEIIVYGILWTQLYADTGSYDINIPSYFGEYRVVLVAKGVT